MRENLENQDNLTANKTADSKPEEMTVYDEQGNVADGSSEQAGKPLTYSQFQESVDDYGHDGGLDRETDKTKEQQKPNFLDEGASFDTSETINMEKQNDENVEVHATSPMNETEMFTSVKDSWNEDFVTPVVEQGATSEPKSQKTIEDPLVEDVNKEEPKDTVNEARNEARKKFDEYYTPKNNDPEVIEDETSNGAEPESVEEKKNEEGKEMTYDEFLENVEKNQVDGELTMEGSKKMTYAEFLDSIEKNKIDGGLTLQGGKEMTYSEFLDGLEKNKVDGGLPIQSEEKPLQEVDLESEVKDLEDSDVIEGEVMDNEEEDFASLENDDFDGVEKGNEIDPLNRNKEAQADEKELTSLEKFNNFHGNPDLNKEKKSAESEASEGVEKGKEVIPVGKKEDGAEGVEAGKEVKEYVPISKEVLSEYERVLNMDEDAIRDIDGFAELSEGRQLLMLQNAQDVLTTTIEADSRKEYKRRQGKLPVKSPLKKASTFVRKIARNVLTLGAYEGFKTAQIQKEIVGDKTSEDNIESNKVLLAGLVKGAQFGPEAHLDKTGMLSVDYLSVGTDIPEGFEKQKGFESLMDDFNSEVTSYTEVPSGWENDSLLSESEKSSYKKDESNYDHACAKLYREFASFEGDTSASKRLIAIKNKIDLQRHLTSNPDSERSLYQIQHGGTLTNALQSMYQSREARSLAAYGAAYKGVGLVLTMFSAGVLAAPVRGALGGYLGGKTGEFNAHKEQSQKSKDMQHVSHKDEKNLREVVTFEVKPLIERRTALEDELRKLGYGSGKEKEKGLLKDRIKVLNERIDRGKDKKEDFGTKERKIKDVTDASFVVHRLNRLQNQIMNKILPRNYDNHEDYERARNISIQKYQETFKLAKLKEERGLINYLPEHKKVLNELDKKTMPDESMEVINKINYSIAMQRADLFMSNEIDKDNRLIVNRDLRDFLDLHQAAGNEARNRKVIKAVKMGAIIGGTFGTAVGMFGADGAEADRVIESSTSHSTASLNFGTEYQKGYVAPPYEDVPSAEELLEKMNSGDVAEEASKESTPISSNGESEEVIINEETPEKSAEDVPKYNTEDSEKESVVDNVSEDTTAESSENVDESPEEIIVNKETDDEGFVDAGEVGMPEDVVEETPEAAPVSSGEAVENVAESAPKTYEVKSGDGLWRIVNDQVSELETFGDDSVARANAVGNIIEKMKSDPDKYNLTDFDNLHPGDEVELGGIYEAFEDARIVRGGEEMDVIDAAENLSDEARENILKTNPELSNGTQPSEEVVSAESKVESDSKAQEEGKSVTGENSKEYTSKIFTSEKDAEQYMESKAGEGKRTVMEGVRHADITPEDGVVRGPEEGPIMDGKSTTDENSREYTTKTFTDEGSADDYIKDLNKGEGSVGDTVESVPLKNSEVFSAITVENSSFDLSHVTPENKKIMNVEINEYFNSILSGEVKDGSHVDFMAYRIAGLLRNQNLEDFDSLKDFGADTANEDQIDTAYKILNEQFSKNDSGVVGEDIMEYLHKVIGKPTGGYEQPIEVVPVPGNQTEVIIEPAPEPESASGNQTEVIVEPAPESEPAPGNQTAQAEGGKPEGGKPEEAKITKARSTRSPQSTRSTRTGSYGGRTMKDDKNIFETGEDVFKKGERTARQGERITNDIDRMKKVFDRDSSKTSRKFGSIGKVFRSLGKFGK